MVLVGTLEYVDGLVELLQANVTGTQTQAIVQIPFVRWPLLNLGCLPFNNLANRRAFAGTRDTVGKLMASMPQFIDNHMQLGSRRGPSNVDSRTGVVNSRAAGSREYEPNRKH